ncbi:MAG: hypothetical protein WC942_09015 [Clostridia bacterium]|jgi:hypothetical protein
MTLKWTTYDAIREEIFNLSMEEVKACVESILRNSIIQVGYIFVDMNDGKGFQPLHEIPEFKDTISECWALWDTDRAAIDAMKAINAIIL